MKDQQETYIMIQFRIQMSLSYLNNWFKRGGAYGSTP